MRLVSVAWVGKHKSRTSSRVFPPSAERGRVPHLGALWAPRSGFCGLCSVPKARNQGCPPERTGPQALFSLGVVSRRICSCFSKNTWDSTLAAAEGAGPPKLYSFSRNAQEGRHRLKKNGWMARAGSAGRAPGSRPGERPPGCAPSLWRHTGPCRPRPADTPRRRFDRWGRRPWLPCCS